MPNQVERRVLRIGLRRRPGGGRGTFTAIPVNALMPVIAGATHQLTLVAIEKLLLKFAAGVNVTPASSALTLAIAPRRSTRRRSAAL